MLLGVSTMQYILDRRYKLMGFVTLIWLVSCIAQPVVAQSESPYMYFYPTLDDNGMASAVFEMLPPGIQEFRWRWDQLPSEENVWEAINVSHNYAFIRFPLPFGADDPLCRNHTLYAEFRDANGNTTLLHAPLIIDQDVHASINVAWPSYAMAGYTNQETVLVQVLDNQDCTGIEQAIMFIDNEIFHYLNINTNAEEFGAYELAPREGLMTIYALATDAVSNPMYYTVSFTRDITPPVLTQVQAVIDDSSHPTRLVVTGRFTDTYTPSPWAIEWQFLDGNGRTIGDAVYHILDANEVQAEVASLSSADQVPFQMSVALGSLPNHAATMQVRIFDRAGNGQLIEPITLITPLPLYTVYIPLAGR